MADDPGDAALPPRAVIFLEHMAPKNMPIRIMQDDIFKPVRSQATKERAWRQHQPSLTNKATGKGSKPLSAHQSEQMSRFRLRAKSQKQIQPKNAKRLEDHRDVGAAASDGSVTATTAHAGVAARMQHQILYGSQVTLGKRFNPFDAKLVDLGPKSEKLIFYCTYLQQYTILPRPLALIPRRIFVRSPRLFYE